MNYSRTDRWAQFESLPRPLTGHFSTPPNLVFPGRHRHAWGQLSYATEGYLQVWTPDARFIALPQRGVWIPPGILHRVRRTSNAVVRSLYLDTQVFGLQWDHCCVLSISPLMHELIREFCTLPLDYDESGRHGRLVQVLVDQLSDCSEAGLILPWPSDPQLRRICLRMQHHPSTEFSLEDLSASLGVSTKTLTRRFQQETGLGFRLWRQRARLIHALPLLERGDRITDVALACGYESLSSFIAIFREHTGVTPGEFARGVFDT
ncbi:AraC family transcriptional regulator [Pusillimonas noertemannii]|uniref:AraC-like DNA-binding protein n=1 Tax=Pusillimonas noertemannii TaxID=305977 RepID=A0A2U1CMR0_9BURK|nr:helix-turn-helix transcriptional regulator [Pusillimonas noertemannii]NYT68687.1 helix-turn-helix transcriptional regulator [Pusillimonas noertemannii]PVY62295.1 AraC-like DNA-binding protein [Pusillimonas noertemannii]TFL10730.1 AraC family transcriptional regulator [Pusillimonas noertemannii]